MDSNLMKLEFGLRLGLEIDCQAGSELDPELWLTAGQVLKYII